MLLLLWMACTPDPCGPGGDPTVEIGAGAGAFEPTKDGELVELTMGQQGGYHFDVTLATTHLDAGDLISGSMVASIDGVDVAGSNPWFGLTCNEAEGRQEATGLRLIFFQDPPDYTGEVDIEVSVTDAGGNTAMGTRIWSVDLAGG